jgi:hypothetical protein
MVVYPKRKGESKRMSIAAYKLIHLLGIFLLMVALGGMAVHAGTGQRKGENPSHRTLMALHGVGAFLVLLGGFGLLARLGLQGEGGFPGWIWGKLLLWVVLGGLVALPYRKPQVARGLIVLVPLLALIGAILANYRPF